MYNLNTKFLRATPSLKIIFLIMYGSTLFYVKEKIKYADVWHNDDQYTKYVFALLKLCIWIQTFSNINVFNRFVTCTWWMS